MGLPFKLSCNQAVTLVRPSLQFFAVVRQNRGNYTLSPDNSKTELGLLLYFSYENQAKTMLEGLCRALL